MKSERRKQYPKNWEQLARQCKEQAGWTCECCHIRSGAKRKSRRTGNRYVVFLHAAHREHDIGNPHLCYSAYVRPVTARMIIVTGCVSNRSTRSG